MVEIEVFVLIDANGGYAVGNSAEAAKEKYAEDIGELAEADGFRIVTVAVNVEAPVAAQASIKSVQ